MSPKRTRTLVSTVAKWARGPSGSQSSQPLGASEGAGSESCTLPEHTDSVGIGFGEQALDFIRMLASDELITKSTREERPTEIEHSSSG